MTTITTELADSIAACAAANQHPLVTDVRNTHGTAHIATAAWLEACGKTPFDEAALSCQIGCHIEEFAEFLRAVYIESNTGITSTAMQELAAHLEGCANVLKSGHAVAKIFDREAALDALCDTEVTGNGVAFLAGMNKTEADCRVIASNYSKFNADGTPVILEGGKIGKSAQYAPPDLTGLYCCSRRPPPRRRQSPRSSAASARAIAPSLGACNSPAKSGAAGTAGAASP